MNLTTNDRYEFIRKLNVEIEKIANLANGHLNIYFKNKLITPLWNLNLDSVIETLQNYDLILNKFINIQLKYVDSNALSIVDHDAIVNHLADILIILSLIVEFYEQEDEGNIVIGKNKC